MRKMVLCAGIAMSALSAASADAAGLLDNYSVSFFKPIDTKEASGVAYNWDTSRLLVVTDEEENDGTTISGEYDLTGTKTASITMAGCLSLGSAQCDPEGVTYVGGGKYAVALERYQDIALVGQTGGSGGALTYTSYPDAPRVSVGPDAGNTGLEGIAYERSTGDYFGVRETPQTVSRLSDVDFGTETATVTTLFTTALGLDRLSDVAVLSGGRFAAAPFRDNLLLLSGRSFKLVEVTKAGALVSSYDLSSFRSQVDPENEGGKFEGVTLDDAGNIYLVSDDGDGPNQSYLLKLQHTGPVPEPATWAMMVSGFGMIGGALRQRRRTAVALA